MKKLLLGLILFTGVITFACKSEEEAKQEDQAQEQHSDSLRNSVLDDAGNDSFLRAGRDSVSAEDSTSTTPEKK
jgi:hypothetical protein